MTYLELALRQKARTEQQFEEKSGEDWVKKLRKQFWHKAYADQVSIQAGQEITLIAWHMGVPDTAFSDAFDVSVGAMNAFKNGEISLGKYETFKTRFSTADLVLRPDEQEKLRDAMVSTINFLAAECGTEESIDRTGFEYLVALSENGKFLNAEPGSMLPRVLSDILKAISRDVVDYYDENDWLQKLEEALDGLQSAGVRLKSPMLHFEKVMHCLNSQAFVRDKSLIDQVFTKFIGPYLVICDEIF